jgi:hypothetical protein
MPSAVIGVVPSLTFAARSPPPSKHATRPSCLPALAGDRWVPA